MANQRLINCDFFLKGAFDDVSSNEAKLLYFYLFINADDCGFVGNADKIIKTLNDENKKSNVLIDYTFENAADELIDKGFLYRFVNKHGNQVLLIRQFFLHNKYNPKYCVTNYISLRAKVELVDGCFEMKGEKEKPKGKENKQSNANNANNQINNINNKEIKNKEISNDDGWDELMLDLESTLPKGDNNGDN